MFKFVADVDREIISLPELPPLSDVYGDIGADGSIWKNGTQAVFGLPKYDMLNLTNLTGSLHTGLHPSTNTTGTLHYYNVTRKSGSDTGLVRYKINNIGGTISCDVVNGMDLQSNAGHTISYMYNQWNLQRPNVDLPDLTAYMTDDLQTVRFSDAVYWQYNGTKQYGRVSKLKRVKFGKSTEFVYDYAFCKCSALTAVDFTGIPEVPSRMKNSPNVGTYALCRNLPALKLPTGTKYIGRHCFDRCIKLNSITADNVISVDACAFSYCTVLTSLSMPSLTAIYHASNRDPNNTVTSLTASTVVKTLPKDEYINVDLKSTTLTKDPASALPYCTAPFFMSGLKELVLTWPSSRYEQVKNYLEDGTDTIYHFGWFNFLSCSLNTVSVLGIPDSYYTGKLSRNDYKLYTQMFGKLKNSGNGTAYNQSDPGARVFALSAGSVS